MPRLPLAVSRPHLLFLSVGALASCAQGMDLDTESPDDAPPLASVDVLLAGAPKADEIEPLDRKADEILPEAHSELRSLQSPVKSQGRRGVCSIFSTVAYMEHLYIAEGTHLDQDFSEQYLQWSAKFEVGSFPNTSGSNAGRNLEAISDFGIVEESVWPYETEQWDEVDDPDCDGEDNQPTRCYTNGHPSDEIKAAPKWHLPRGRWLRARDIKTHIAQTGTGVVTGLTFFYQAWNHRKSDIPVNQDSWDQGFVIYPSEEDKELSLEKRAGHSILIYGWDDNQEMPVLDEEGAPLRDDDGEIVMEKGCYLFKNSWGTSGFGIDSQWGPGYGCISYRYVHEYGRVNVTGLPSVERPEEVCGDEIDNDGDDAVDCQDPDCAEDAACEEGDVLTFEGEGGLSIPDNDPVGVGSSIHITETGTVASMRVQVDIDHTYRGDLRVSLHRGSEAVVLHNRTGGALDQLHLDVDVDDFAGEELEGEWRLVVVDQARVDVGTLVGWSLTVGLDD